VAVRAIIKQAKLRAFYRTSAQYRVTQLGLSLETAEGQARATEFPTLKEAIESALDSASSKTSDGRVLTGEAGNGFSASFAVLKDFTPEQALELAAELLNVYALAVTDLSDDGTSSPTDLQIHDRMLLLLAPVTEQHSDYSQMCLR
jgi:hypothetical protein